MQIFACSIGITLVVFGMFSLFRLTRVVLRERAERFDEELGVIFVFFDPEYL